MKTCAYCNNPLEGKTHHKTDEHIIPNSLLHMFPEQDITFHRGKQYVDNRGLTISDVCATCNNGILSELDSYGKSIIEKYFLHTFKYNDYSTSYNIEIDSDIYIRWLLKIVYNSMRVDKFNTKSMISNIPYIMGETSIFPENISVLIGFHINLTPVPEEIHSNMPLQINYSPTFYLDSIMNMKEGKTIKHLQFRGVDRIFSLRFASFIGLIILWKPSACIDVKTDTTEALRKLFRFEILSSNCKQYSINCVSAPTNVILSGYSHFCSEKVVANDLSLITLSLHGRDIGTCYEDFSKSWTPKMSRQGRILVEAAQFPDNKKKQQALNDL